MKCKWYADFEGVCTNGECPYRGDTCPTSEHPEVCKHAEAAPEVLKLKAPRLSAKELAKTLRLCDSVSCTGCALFEFVNCGSDAKQQAADMLEKLAAEKDEKKPEWISVKDRLPERDRKVLVIDGHNDIRILAFWRKNGNEWEWITETYGISRKNDVKMWMPLPELPKEEKR